ncbi:MAG: recombinase RecA [Planctomycetota bacterium]|nr:recombinase RecA [Planctomycetota bacterium]MDI6788575.1 recombinase RecA [Planctomycetota bacterium]
MTETSPKKQEDKGEGKKMEALQQAIAQIEKQFGKGAIMRLGGAGIRTDIPCISTGALSLDIAVGGRGVPRGRIIEVFGPEASGKTTICLHIVANAQKAGGTAAFIDVEHSLDPTYAQNIGVNMDNLLISQPDSGEQALETTETLVRSNAMDIVVLDSVAALVPKSELEGAMGELNVGLQARLMSQALRKLAGAISKSQTCVVFTNQLREKIGISWGNPETTPGGRAMKFYASVRLDIRKTGTIKNANDEVIGSRVKVNVVKNKVAPPFKKAEFDLLHVCGISREGDLIDLGIHTDIVEKSGAWLDYKKTRLGQGREKAKEFFKENPKILAELETDIRKHYGLIV